MPVRRPPLETFNFLPRDSDSTCWGGGTVQTPTRKTEKRASNKKRWNNNQKRLQSKRNETKFLFWVPHWKKEEGEKDNHHNATAGNFPEASVPFRKIKRYLTKGVVLSLNRLSIKGEERLSHRPFWIHTDPADTSTVLAAASHHPPLNIFRQFKFHRFFFLPGAQNTKEKPKVD